jgi:ABC-type phosphate transport system ATPase subunit
MGRQDHGLDRALGVRQEHGAALPQPHTRDLFTNPRDQRTEDYITGRFG